MAGAIRTHVSHAGTRIAARCDRLEDRADSVPGLLCPTRHERGAEPRSVLTSRHAGSDKMETLRFETSRALLCVFEPGVPAVDQDVTRLEVRNDALNRLIDGLAGLDHHHDPARPLDRSHQLGKALRRHEFFPGVLRQKTIRPFALEIPYRE